MVFPLALSKFTGAEYPAKITVPFGFTCAVPTIPPKVPSPFVSAVEEPYASLASLQPSPSELMSR